jgi:hypothetical protein
MADVGYKVVLFGLAKSFYSFGDDLVRSVVALNQVVTDTERRGQLAIHVDLCLTEVGKQNNGDLPHPGTLLDLLEDMEAVELGHQDIEEDKLRSKVIELLEALFSIGSYLDLMAF